MHPLLSEHTHPDCVQAMDALKQCHRERSIAKFWGACNDYKYALDKCLAAEYKSRRRENFERAQYEKQRRAQKKQQRAEQ